VCVCVCVGVWMCKKQRMDASVGGDQKKISAKFLMPLCSE
jgi:hypothetical protein